MQKSIFNYLPPLGVLEVDSALDWSWLVDLGQGNFEAAKIAADRALVREKNTRTLFARAVVHQLQGEYKRALLLLELAFESATEVEEKYIIAAVSYLTELKAGEHFPDHFSLNFETIALDSVWRQEYKSLQSQVDLAYTQLEGSFLFDVAAVLPNFRATISKLNSHNTKSSNYQDLFPATEGIVPDRSYGHEYLEEIQAQLTKQLETYQSLDIFQVVHLLYSVMAEFLSLGGSTKEGLEILENLTQACLKSENYREAAWYLLSQGDILINFSFGGKAICFGYCLTDFFTNQERENLSEDTDLSELHEIYDRSREYFHLSRSPRGEAMAIMRLAYLNAMSDRWYLANQGYEEARERFAQLGDRLNAMAAAMGKLWTSAHYEEPDLKAIALAEELITSAKDSGALAWGVSWGFAFARAANSALVERENLQAALWCTSLAETIFAAFAQPLGKIDTRSLETYYQFIQSKILQPAFAVGGAMQKLYANLAGALANSNNWTEAFTVSEMVRACLLSAFLGKTKNTAQSVRATDKTIFLEEIATYLPPQTLLISYILLDKQILIWAVSSVGLVATYNLQEFRGKPFDAESFLKDAIEWSEGISRGNTDDSMSLILEKSLLSPVSDRLKAANQLIFVPPPELNLFPFHTLPWCNLPLGLQKSVSYLPTASQLQQFHSNQLDLQNILIINAIEGILTEANSSDRLKQLTSSFIVRATAKSLAQISQVQILNATETTKKDVLNALTLGAKCIHLYVHLDDAIGSSVMLAGGETISCEEIRQLNIQAEGAILSIFSQKQRQFTSNELFNLTQSLIDAGVKAVLVKMWHGDDIANSMLIQCLHRNLAKGQSLGEAFLKSQKYLSQITIQKALDFCRDVQAYIAWQESSERADRAILTQYVGDLLAFGGNYTRAAEAYQVTIKILTEVGYSSQVEAIDTKYKYLRSLTNHQIQFNPNLLIFNAPEYWGTFAAIGNF